MKNFEMLKQLNLLKAAWVAILPLMMLGKLQAQIPNPYYTQVACQDPYVLAFGQAGTTFVGNGDDNTFTVQLPFTFNYVCANYTSVTAGTNGFVGFPAGTARGFGNVNVPTTQAGACLYPFWDDLHIGASPGSGIYTRTDGVAPNRIFTIEWYKAGHFVNVANQDITFQVRFFENGNIIQFKYLDVFFGGSQAAFDQGRSATIGWEGVPGAPRNFGRVGFNTPSVNDNQCIQFNPPPPACPGFFVPNITLSMAPGTCSALVNLQDYVQPRGCMTTFTPPGPEFFGGTTTVTATAGCSSVSFTVFVQDTEFPVIVGCPKAVVINLGPGECEGSWDAPPFMAMDNCAGGGGAIITSPGCQLGANNFLTATGFYIGLMFNIQNTSPQLVRVQGLSFMPNNQFGNLYRIYTTTAPGTWQPVANNAAAWTQVADDMMKNGQTGFPAPNPRLLIPFDLTTEIAMAPGESRGMAIYGAVPSVTQYYVNGAAPCSTTPQGDANLKIDVVGGRVQFGNGFFQVSGTFSVRMFNGDVNYLLGAAMIDVVQTCGQPYGPGTFFPIGCTTLCFEATDAQGNTTTCQFDVCVNEYANYVTALACHDEIQISLDEDCFATISADEVLAGGPYHCYDDYTVEIRDWITNAIVDRDPNTPGSQVGVQDIGRELKVTVRDPATGNSCWGHATVEDKLPPTFVECARDTCVPCYSETTPFYTGSPIVDENCSSYSLTYKDNVTYGSCAIGNDRVIRRTWTAVDASGNKASCVQTITVSLGSLLDAQVPLDWDNIENPMLSCDGKINPNKDVTPHYLAFPYCVDGYLLDSAHWFATGGFLPSPQGDLAGERLPKVLGWNCLDAGPYAGHPSPYPIYYPAHPS
ncbi:MAG TPA: HYR domain-containing protein, partial [Saprospiraceae bacterium]|nr:HYR domain-containing protein [Saprospiraceae bacterium]